MNVWLRTGSNRWSKPCWPLPLGEQGKSRSGRTSTAGAWIGAQAANPLHSAINGTVVPHAHSDGLDFAAPLHFARPNGLSGMLSLYFQQGTNALKALVKYQVEREEALYAISAHDGAARVFS